MKVSFGGIGESVATFYNSQTDGTSSGELVKISGNGEVCRCVAGDRFAGIAISADDSFAAVQIGGFVTAAYEGLEPAIGFSKLLAASSGAVKEDAAGAEFLVIEVDTGAKTVGFII